MKKAHPASSQRQRNPKKTFQKPNLLSPPANRPKRRAGRSLLERNPDWVQFAPEGREGKRDRKKDKSIAESEISKMDEEILDVWKGERFRREHRKMLEFALSQWSGWNSAIRTGSDMEREVFKKAASQEEYLAGINRLVTQFKKKSTPPVKGQSQKPKLKEKTAHTANGDNTDHSSSGDPVRPSLGSSNDGSANEVDSVTADGKNTVSDPLCFPLFWIALTQSSESNTSSFPPAFPETILHVPGDTASVHVRCEEVANREAGSQVHSSGQVLVRGTRCPAQTREKASIN